MRATSSYRGSVSEWNGKVNLISRKETKFFENHILPILPLAEEFMKESCETNHLDVTGFSDEAVKKIMGYDWPENVRQLKHTIDRAVVLTRSGQIQADEIEIEDIVNVKNPLSLKNEEQEKEKIIKAIAMTSSYDEAAELLGITRETLFQKRKKYGLTKR